MYDPRLRLSKNDSLFVTVPARTGEDLYRDTGFITVRRCLSGKVDHVQNGFSEKIVIDVVTAG
jgi:hypothetical protein